MAVEFLRLYPDIQLELVLDDRFATLTDVTGALAELDRVV